MKKYLINYAHNSHYDSQKNNSQSGLLIGGFDEAISYKYSDIDSQFKEKNSHILEQQRGAGYWLWKSYIIKKTLDNIQYDDILFYSDSGISFIRPIDDLIEVMDSTEEKMLLFELEDIHPNRRWTKRDCFILMDLDKEPFLSNNMLLASYLLMRKNKFVEAFIDEWLNYGQDYRIITDSPNEMGENNYSDCDDHRHDQSILSLLGRKYNIKNIPDVSQYGYDPTYRKNNISNIPQILDHHRIRN